MRLHSRTRPRLGWLLAGIALAGGLPAAVAEPSAREPLPLIGELAEADRCDPLDPAACLLPWPNDHFTVPDAGQVSGRRVNISLLSTPRNVAGKPIVPTEWNRNDGFSPGSGLLTVVPGLNLKRTGAPTLRTIDRSLATDSPVVVINTRTGRRHPVFAELDINDPGRRTLIVRPARNFDEATTYVVALRRLRDDAGAVIPAQEVFRAFRDGSGVPTELAKRRPHMEQLFSTLRRAGIARRELYLAWDFTIASATNIAGRMLHIRDDAFHKLGTAAPTFTVDAVKDYSLQENRRIARQVTGTFLVPSYLNLPGGPPGSVFNYLGSDDGLPRQLPGNMQHATYTCRIPRSVVAFASDPASQVRPGHASLYGHGLLGDQGEVGAGNVSDMANEHRFVFCATDWQGMSMYDLGSVAAILVDASNFPLLADRVQQGMLNQLFLARLMIHQYGFGAVPAFQVGGKPLIDRSAVYYDGNSQGGIIGGALMAVAQDIKRGVLGVPGMNYSILLNRSVDFDQYSQVMYSAYPDKLDQQIIFGMMQMLWDRAEANGYAAHMTDNPYPNTPAHQILLHPAYGDHQVASLSVEVEARTIGARLHWPAFGTKVARDNRLLWGIHRWDEDRTRGSAMVYWDSGTPNPPDGNIPPEAGQDPHETPRRQPNARVQKAKFLTTGWIIDTCNDGPCNAVDP